MLSLISLEALTLCLILEEKQECEFKLKNQKSGSQ